MRGISLPNLRFFFSKSPLCSVIVKYGLNDANFFFYFIAGHHENKWSRVMNDLIPSFFPFPLIFILPWFLLPNSSRFWWFYWNICGKWSLQSRKVRGLHGSVTVCYYYIVQFLKLKFLNYSIDPEFTLTLYC